MKFYCGDEDQWKDEISQLIAGDLPNGWVWVKSSVNTKVAYHEKSPSVYYKEFIPRSFFEGVKSLIRGSRCVRAINQQKVLTDLDFNTPEVFCAGKIKSYEFMVSEAFDGVGFGDYLASFFRHATGERLKLKRQLLDCVGGLVGELHLKGMVHGDLRPNNILVFFEGGKFTFSLIDNERNKVYKKLPYKKIHKNLVQITMFTPEDLTKTDRLRLWKSWERQCSLFYLDKTNGLRSDALSLMRDVYFRVCERLKNKKADDLVSANVDKKHDPLFKVSKS